MNSVVGSLLDYLGNVTLAAGALALLLLAGWCLKAMAGWRWNADLAGVLQAIFEWFTGNAETLNVEFRSASGGLMDLTKLIHCALRNGHGGLVRLVDGIFQCNARYIEAGAPVVVTIQHVLHETLIVQVDSEKHVPFVQSKFSTQEIIDLVSQGLATPGQVRAPPTTAQLGT